MECKATSLAGVLIIEPKVYGDERGFFLQTYVAKDYKQIGLPEFVQCNISRSKKGVLRGLHYQLVQPQGKLVQVTRGKVFDVAVDIRVGSPTFGQWTGCILDDVTHKQFYIPPDFAHGFIVLSEEADFEYWCTDYYHPASEQGIYYADKHINIDWQCDKLELILSEKDKQAKTLNEQPVALLPAYRCE